jgi:biopolymer transport protein ExbD
MRRPLVSPTSEIARINVTPIIDVALVLVIILLVTAPILAVKDYAITLPEAHTRGAEDELRIHISIGPEGEIALDEDEIPLTALSASLQQRFQDLERDDVLVVVRADAGASYATVREVLRMSRAGGASRLAVATTQAAQDTGLEETLRRLGRWAGELSGHEEPVGKESAS